MNAIRFPLFAALVAIVVALSASSEKRAVADGCPMQEVKGFDCDLSWFGWEKTSQPFCSRYKKDDCKGSAVIQYFMHKCQSTTGNPPDRYNCLPRFILVYSPAYGGWILVPETWTCACREDCIWDDILDCTIQAVPTCVETTKFQTVICP